MFKLSWFVVVLYRISCQTYYAYSATSNNIVSPCHCDFTSSFCDYNCCCDSDCSEDVKNTLKSNNQVCTTNIQESYCFDASYYAKINVQPNSSSTSGSQTCYSFDPTFVQAELNMSYLQAVEYVKSTLPTAIANGGYSTSYTIQTPIFTNIEKLIGDDGFCLASPNTATTNIMFGRNQTVRCSRTSTSCQSTSITLFKNILGKTISEFLNGGSQRQIPGQATAASKCLSTLTVLIFYNKLGNTYSGVPYIVKIKNLEQSNDQAPSTYTLKIRFIDLSVQLKAPQQITSPGFFPQIPPDMFYPIFYSNGIRLGVLIVTLICMF